MYNFLVFPLIHTERLKLRKLTVDDFPGLIKHANNKSISDQIINIPYPYQEHNAVHRMSYVQTGFNERSRFVFAIEPKEIGELIGEISLHLAAEKTTAEIGYWISEVYWNQGFASEAIKGIIQFAIEKLDLQSVFATVHENNISCKKVLGKNSFQLINTNGNVCLYRIDF